ncbi:PucR family transcriptional regulator [Leucobacter massiliensis]|uniref:PucR C-terminal helix-turn-helix domain-containing protein n=1 Tax=Leucobacter massiliensis TaxID=1686285 RepID=A0A2S9QSV5_9MICO|nr:helix-turn-helix domain-containing protein [Leucobacter massiliensis]PRI12648.1 hypothetical protein B4915_00185 [Leucobacter massiliensis]
MPPSHDDPGSPLLLDVLRVVGGGIARRLTPDSREDVPVGRVTILDPLEPELAAGDILLAVGVDARADAFAALRSAADEAGVAALVVGVGDPRGVAGAESSLAGAPDGGPGVYLRAPWVSWSDTAAAFRMALRGARTQLEAPETGIELGDLDAVAELIAARVRGSVTIEDLDSQVLAYSSTGGDVDARRREAILRRRVPPERVRELLRSGFLQWLSSTTEVVHRPAGEGEPERLVIAVRAAGEMIGSIWVADLRGDVEEASAALRDSANLAVPHLLYASALRAGRLHDATAAVHELLSGEVPPAEAASRAGLTADAAAGVLRIGLADGTRLAGARTRLAERLGALAGHYGCRVSTIADAGEVTAVLSGFRDIDAAGTGLWSMAQSLGDGPGSREMPLVIGVGEAAPSLHTLAASAESAAAAFAALRWEGRSGAARLDEVAEGAALHHIHRLLRGAQPPVATPVDRLRAHDAEHGSDLTRTLDEYLAAFGNVTATAAALNYHPNSLRYRLNRIQEISGIRLDDPDSRLLAQLQLRLMPPA